jgi:hypothetical protein
MCAVFGQILGATSKAELNTAAINLNIVFVVGSVAAFIRAWLFTLAGQRLVARLRIDLFKAVSVQVYLLILFLLSLIRLSLCFFFVFLSLPSVYFFLSSFLLFAIHSRKLRSSTQLAQES